MPTPTEKLIDVTLSNPISINGIKYEAGTHNVPAEIAEDLKKYDNAYTAYEAQLNKNNPVNGNLGSVSAS